MAAPNFFKNFYRGGTGFLALTALAQIWLGISSGNQEFIATGVATLLGTLVPATAERRLSGQIKDGTLGSPAEAVANGLRAIAETQAAAKAEYDKVLDVVSALPSITSTIPVVGPAVADSIDGLTKLPNAVDLINALMIKSRETE